MPGNGTTDRELIRSLSVAADDLVRAIVILEDHPRILTDVERKALAESAEELDGLASDILDVVRDAKLRTERERTERDAQEREQMRQIHRLLAIPSEDQP